MIIGISWRTSYRNVYTSIKFQMRLIGLVKLTWPKFLDASNAFRYVRMFIALASHSYFNRFIHGVHCVECTYPTWCLSFFSSPGRWGDSFESVYLFCFFFCCFFVFVFVFLLRYLLPDSRGSCVSQIITKTCLFKYVENFTSQIENFRVKTLIFFHISAKNIDCGYSRRF